jgi:polyvinyl alcohol dehydrogenase (cytochrome)
MTRSAPRLLFLIALLVLSYCFAGAATQSGSSVNGVWKGTVRLAGGEHRVVLHISSQASGSASGTLDSPDTGKLAIALESVKADGKTLAFEASDPKISFSGKIGADANELTGDWKQDGQTVTVTLGRLEQAPDFEKDGAYLFLTRCAMCHTPFNATRAPWPSTLKLMTQPAILAALDNGKMQAQGGAMSPEQRFSVSAYLGRAEKPGQAQAAPVNACAANAPAMKNSPLWNGWGVDLANSRFQPAARAGLNKDQLSRLKVKWAFGYAGAAGGGGQPTIVGDRIFVAGGDSRIYSLDMHSGCVYWAFVPAAGARTAITVSEDGTTAYFGDFQGRAYALDAATGALKWKTELDTHRFAIITGAPKLYGARLYVPVSSAEELGGASPQYPCCTFRGNVTALDAKTGKLIWKTYTIDKAAEPTTKNSAGTQMYGPSGAGVWNSPTIDPVRHALYVGTGDNYTDPGTPNSDAIVAMDLDTGKILWVNQLTADDRFNIGCVVPDNASCPAKPGGDFDIGAAPILRTLPGGKRLLLVGQKSGVAFALDPDDRGKKIWETRIGKGGTLGGIEFGGAADEKTVYYPLSDWRPDPKAGGGMFALDIATGKIVWSTPAPQPACLAKPGCSPSQQAPATLIPGVVFSGSLDGHIRAYDVADGKIAWDFDTAQDFPTVNRVEAHGGSLNYASTVVAGGMVFVAAGYSTNAGMPGNVLLAFSVDGK